MSVNRVIIVGHLGRNPEFRTTGSGQSVANFSIATTEKIKDQEHTEWHRIVAWGKLAEICAQYLKKGRQVYIEGRITTRQFDAKDGSGKRSVTEIVAQTIHFLGHFLGGGESSSKSAGPREPGDDDIF